jgi:histidinol-phosphate phosphatase family protein
MRQYPPWLQSVDSSWTLFLDRDGTINKRLVGDYVTSFDQFEFLPKVIDALAVASVLFDKIIIVTNQQGVGKGLMTQADLDAIHQGMLTQIIEGGGYIDQIFSCTQLATEWDNCRKPGHAMALQALAAFPQINLFKSIMIGDMPSDILFADNSGMKSAYMGNLKDLDGVRPHMLVNDLWEFTTLLQDAIYSK